MLVNNAPVFVFLMTQALNIVKAELSTKACLSRNPGYILDKSHEAIFQGCYHSDGVTAVLPRNSLINFRKAIDWESWVQNGYAKDVIEKCGNEAIKKGVSYFGVEFYGECYLGNTPNFSPAHVTEADGCSTLCSDDVGGPSAIVVYKVEAWAPKCETWNVGYYIDDTHWAWNRGCYHQNTNSWVFPIGTFANLRYSIDWHEMSDMGHGGTMVKRCGLIALENGAEYFGIEFYGNCYYGSNPNFGNGEMPCGPTRKCYWDIGKRKGISLYKIEDIQVSS